MNREGLMKFARIARGLGVGTVLGLLFGGADMDVYGTVMGIALAVIIITTIVLSVTKKQQKIDGIGTSAYTLRQSNCPRCGTPLAEGCRTCPKCQTTVKRGG